MGTNSRVFELFRVCFRAPFLPPNSSLILHPCFPFRPCPLFYPFPLFKREISGIFESDVLQCCWVCTEHAPRKEKPTHPETMGFCSISCNPSPLLADPGPLDPRLTKSSRRISSTWQTNMPQESIESDLLNLVLSACCRWRKLWFRSGPLGGAGGNHSCTA